MSTFTDATVAAAIQAEVSRQQDELELIASENYASRPSCVQWALL